MNEETIARISAELDSAASGRRFGRIFQTGALGLAFDLRLPGERFLFVSCDPLESRLHLIKRKTKELEKDSRPPGPFASALRQRLGGARIESVEKVRDERAVEISLIGETEFGEETRLTLMVQLTGRSSNVFLLDSNGLVIECMRATAGDGQERGDAYRPPAGGAGRAVGRPDPFAFSETESASEAVDAFYREREATRRSRARIHVHRAKLSKEAARRKDLLEKLAGDLAGHGDPETWKREGELLLANSSNAKRSGNCFVVTDYFSDSAPEVLIGAEENESVTEAAERCFGRYAKAKRAKEQIASRMELLKREVADLEEELAAFDRAVAEGRAEVAEVQPEKGGPKAGPKSKARAGVPGSRIFKSSDGYEILVGKGAKDNDRLTFKTAKSFDIWLHAADYPGSHVVVRCSRRDEEVPQRTLIEAAQLAAFYSDARGQSKAAVNHTRRKNVNKPRGGAPGLVSLSGFKTVLVEPMVPPGVSRD